MDAKNALRAEMRRLRTAIPGGERTSAAAAVCRSLLELPQLHDATAIALYAPLPEELDVVPALLALSEDGVAVLLPRVADDDLELVPFTSTSALAPGYRGVREPTGTPAGDRLDAVVVPGLAFDRSGRRLGQGGGHYDRLLARLGSGPVRIGVGFDFQVVAEVPAVAHDERVDLIVTERRTIPTEAGEHLPD
ncbi:MAG: 5-formyltetrahydrofolate cyclo-ligase [Nitriliruptorales bacterium]